jgi:hypothetical protein
VVGILKPAGEDGLGSLSSPGASDRGVPPALCEPTAFPCLQIAIFRRTRPPPHLDYGSAHIVPLSNAGPAFSVVASFSAAWKCSHAQPEAAPHGEKQLKSNYDARGIGEIARKVGKLKGEDAREIWSPGATPSPDQSGDRSKVSANAVDDLTRG